MTTEQPVMLSIFKSRLSSVQHVLKDGSVAAFFRRQPHESAGHYLTADPDKIAELTALVKKGHQHIYIDPEESEVEQSLADPAVAKEQAIRDDERAKVIAELGDANQPRALSKTIAAGINAVEQKDLGATDMASKLAGIGNSFTIAGSAAESNATK
jgi:hypothetical protein